jgi:hypothetical protein
MSLLKGGGAFKERMGSFRKSKFCGKGKLKVRLNFMLDIRGGCKDEKKKLLSGSMPHFNRFLGDVLG